jgi:Fe-S-cluster-containing dehydrogenase component
VSAATPAFVHDLATCVGCHACVVACAVENGTAPGGFWRQVVTFNEDRLPGRPVYHVSVACNHCLDAPCARHCPALAISRDVRTGAVLVDGDRCIGCRYCAWVCPYDAPRFDAGRGVMGKCTLCHDRLLGGAAPACTRACPTGALKLGTLEGDGALGVPGFPDAGARPAIRVLPLRWRRPEPSPEEAAAADAGVAMARPATRDRISFASEWPLFAFTSTFILLVAWLAGSRLGGPPVSLPAFLAAGLGGLALATLHLGRRERAWRAALNWRRSWLSREAIAVVAVLGLAAVGVRGQDSRPDPLLLAVGFLALFCMDQVYTAVAGKRRPRLDDTAAVASALLLAGVASMQPGLAVAAGLIRLAGFGERLRARQGPWGPGLSALATARVGIGLALPLTAVLVAGPAGLPVALAGAVIGELLDRAHFYGSLEVTRHGA